MGREKLGGEGGVKEKVASGGDIEKRLFFLGRGCKILEEHIIMQKIWEKKYFYSNLSKRIICVNQSFIFKNFCISCLILIICLSNKKMKINHTKNQFKWVSFEISYTIFSKMET